MGRLLITALLLGGLLAPGSGDTDGRLTLAPESRLWVAGTSTTQAYTCETTRLSAEVALAAGTTGTRLAGLAGAVRGVTFSLPTASLECGNGTMNRHMLEALQAQSHSTIRFRTTSHEVIPGAAGEGRVRLGGRLSLAGRENTIQVTARATEQADGSLRVRGEHRLEMTSYGIRPPRLMMGTLRVHDPVIVHFDLVLRP